MPKTRTIVINDISFKIKDKQIRQLINPYVWHTYHEYQYKEWDNNYLYLEDGCVNTLGTLTCIYNKHTKNKIFVKIREKTIDELVRAYTEAKNHVWPDLGIEMQPMGLKCNYWDTGFRIQATKVKNYYRIRIFKHTLIEKDWYNRKRAISYKTDYEGLKNIIMEAKLILL